MIKLALALLAVLLVASPAFGQAFNTDPNGTGNAIGTRLRHGNSSFYSFTAVTDSNVVQITPGPFSFEFNPDTTGIATGGLVTLVRCTGRSKTDNCAPYYIDLDGDGIIDQEPFDGVTPGKRGFDIPYFGARWIYIDVTAVTVGQRGSVKIEN